MTAAYLEGAALDAAMAKFKATCALAAIPAPDNSKSGQRRREAQAAQAAQTEKVRAEAAATSSAFVGDRGDMSRDVLDGRLGEICERRMLKDFPISYAWPSLISVAGVAVPMVIPTYGKVAIGEPMTNSFVGLIGPVHSGKSQSMLWARQALDIAPSKYSVMRPASSEGLLKVLADRKSKEGLPSNLLIDFDEWSHIFAKIGIQHSSFATFFTTAFDKRIHDVILAGGNHVQFECSFSFFGGIVEDLFGEIFGAGSLGGLHDRFLFGLCPDGFNFQYRPFEGAPEVTDPIAVTIDSDVWEMIAGLRKQNPTMAGTLKSPCGLRISVRPSTAARYSGQKIANDRYQRSFLNNSTFGTF